MKPYRTIPVVLTGAMKRSTLVLVLMAGLVAASTVPAAADFVQTVNVYEYSVGGTIDWSHTYDHSADPIASVSLTIVADDVDGPGNGLDGEQDEVWVTVGATNHYLGLLNDMGYYTNWSYQPGPGNSQQPLTTTAFNLDPTWLDGLPVQVSIESAWGVEIETSTLTVVQEVAAVPAPAAVLLCVIGLGTFRLFRRWLFA